jgi:hypothetical protein
MSKRILFFALALFSISAIHAQTDKPVTFGGGIRLAYPTGDFGEGWGFGVGGELQGEARVASSVTIPFSAGYTRFIGKKFLGERLPGIGLIPILGGLRIYPSSNFFIGGKVGYGILVGEGESEGAFNYEPQIGYNGRKVQVGFGYNGLTKDGETLGHLALVTILKFN